MSEAALHPTYVKTRGELEEYFDRTAASAWAKLTSDAPVSGVRATVRRGRDQTRANLLSYLPADLRGKRVLDAGCGTGALAIEAARRGAEVIAVDLAGSLLELAKTRLPSDLGEGSVSFHAGDMLSPDFGHFDHVVAMDSIIHYRGADMVRVLSGFAARTSGSVLFTIPPQNALLFVKLGVGRLFPRSDRSPQIQPISPQRLTRLIATEPSLSSFRMGRTDRVDTGFYISQAMELLRA